MQSFLQYRRAAAAAQAQIDRDVEKARGNLLPDIKREGAGQGPSDEEKKEESGPDSSILNEGTADIEECPVSMHRNTTNEVIQQCQSAGVALSQVLTGIHVRDHDARGHGQKVFVVDWQGPDDPLNPQNWSLGRRIGVTLQISVIALFVGAASGIDAAVLPQAAASLGVSEVAESLATGALR